MLKTCVKIFACKHHANDTSRHPCAFETKPRNTGNADGAGRASSALALADAVVTDVVLVDDFVVDLVLLILVDVFVDDIDTVLDVVLVDTLVVDRVLVLVDTVLDVVLVDAVVDDFVLVMLVDAVVDVVQLEVGGTGPHAAGDVAPRGILHVAGWTCYLAALGLSKVEGVPANVANDLSTGLGPAFICFPPMEMSMNPIFACGAHAFYCGHNV